jgi:hypothetical protein
LAAAEDLGTLLAMQPQCEVCENFRPDAEFDPSRKLVEVVFDSRSVLLCRAHAGIAERSGVTSLAELREYYGTGRRSFVPRRERGSTPHMNERRGDAGRRASDIRR